jgi:hypothetical protein
MENHPFQNRLSAERGGVESLHESAGRGARRLARGLAVALAAGLLATGFSAAPGPAMPGKVADDFMPLVELAPFKVNGKQLAISVHARSKGDRRYAEDFAEDVVKVVYEGVSESTGKGLVIIGRKGEPHPIFVFRKFLALAKDGKLDPAVAVHGPELTGMLEHWKTIAGEGKDADAEGKSADEKGTGDKGGVDLDFDRIVTALPLPLEGIGAKLYQLAWAEGFDDARVDARLRALRPADLEGSLFARFDWVFYLPPRGAFEQVIDDLVDGALKEEKMGFFARTVAKTALLAVKPTIRRAIEGMRRGLLFETVVRARTGFAPEKVSALTDAYMEIYLPEGKSGPGSDHDRAVRAVRTRLQEFDAKAKPALDTPRTE